MELPEDQQLPFGTVAYTSPLTLHELGLKNQTDPEKTFQPTMLLTVLQPFLLLVQLVSGSLPRLVALQLARGFSQILVTKEFAINKSRRSVIRELVLLQQGVPLQPAQTLGLDRVYAQIATVALTNFLEWFSGVQQVTSLLRKRGLVGPHLVETW